LFPPARWQNARSIMTELDIQAGKTERHYWADLWRYRELFFFLSWRDILVRYKQTVIGVLWAVIRPLLTTVIFTIIGGRLAKLPSDGLPYAVLVFAAMLPWQFFAQSLTEASNSLITNSNMISKIYFPRLIIPASSVIVSFVDFLISSLILAALMAWYHVPPTWRLLLLPLFTGLAFFASFGVSLWLAALNVKYRDFRYVIPFIVQFGLYVSPVMFTSSIIRNKLGATVAQFYCLNPMVGVIDGFRWAVGSQADAYLGSNLLVSLAVTALLLFSGVKYFRATEKVFADII
jgi:lipopolysaccharide transport system permease protein